MTHSSHNTVALPDTTNLLRVGALELDLTTVVPLSHGKTNRIARRGDRQFYLQLGEFQLLQYLMERSGQLVTHAQLFRDVWHYKFVPETTDLIKTQMGKLRRKVDGPNDAPMIHNVRGMGFILNATACVKRLAECVAAR
jgi:DNA-binding response OmpR family regulator